MSFMRQRLINLHENFTVKARALHGNHHSVNIFNSKLVDVFQVWFITTAYALREVLTMVVLNVNEPQLDVLLLAYLTCFFQPLAVTGQTPLLKYSHDDVLTSDSAALHGNQDGVHNVFQHIAKHHRIVRLVTDY